MGDSQSTGGGGVPATTHSTTGSPRPSDVCRFYDEAGWRTHEGKSLDLHLFGPKEDGPIRRLLNGIHERRIECAIRAAGQGVKLLECGCGGNPARSLLEHCAKYTGVDFSETGLQRAGALLADAEIPCDLRKADIQRMPFSSGQFDAVLCAHVLYHIPGRAEQLRSLREMLRVLRPGGVLVLITANPHPLLFPVRLLKRLAAAVPGVAAFRKSLGLGGLLSYNPPSLGWLRRHLKRDGAVEIVSAGMPSTWFQQRVSEVSPMGGVLWRLIRHLDRNFEHFSAYLGNYAQVTVRRNSI